MKFDLPTLPPWWPVFTLINMISYVYGTDEKRKSVDKKETGSYSLSIALLTRHLRMITYVVIAYFAMKTTYPDNGNIDKLNINLVWIFKVILRDLFITIFFYGGWEFILYSKYSIFRKKLASRKYNPEYPDKEQTYRDIKWSLLSTVISSFVEIIIIYFYKINIRFIFYSNFWQYPISSILWLLFIPYWRMFHFYWIHRMSHPWKPSGSFKWIPDIGQFLYKNFHSLHHKSYNTSPWNGLCMHPIDLLLYLSGILVPLSFGISQHVIHILFSKYHATISVVSGHDGYDLPASGNLFHYLHHAHFECNYGTPVLPFDYWFGTFSDGTKYMKQKNKNKNKNQNRKQN